MQSSSVQDPACNNMFAKNLQKKRKIPWGQTECNTFIDESLATFMLHFVTNPLQVKRSKCSFIRKSLGMLVDVA
jgi:hypothetical protein